MRCWKRRWKSRTMRWYLSGSCLWECFKRTVWKSRIFCGYCLGEHSRTPLTFLLWRGRRHPQGRSLSILPLTTLRGLQKKITGKVPKIEDFTSEITHFMNKFGTEYQKTVPRPRFFPKTGSWQLFFLSREKMLISEAVACASALLTFSYMHACHLPEAKAADYSLLP